MEPEIAKAGAALGSEPRAINRLCAIHANRNRRNREKTPRETVHLSREAAASYFRETLEEVAEEMGVSMEDEPVSSALIFLAVHCYNAGLYTGQCYNVDGVMRMSAQERDEEVAKLQNPDDSDIYRGLMQALSRFNKANPDFLAKNKKQE